jgi:hypothetical protein
MPRSLPAFGLQQFPAAIFPVERANELLDIELLAQAGIEFADADPDGRPKLIEPRDALKQLAAKLLLRCLRQGRRPGHRQLQRLNHIH